MKAPTLSLGTRKLALWAFGAIAVIFLVGSVAMPVRGAETISIKRMHISIQPEYDDPRVLIIYEGELASGPTLPQEVRFPAPNGAEIGQVCALKQPGNEHLCQLYKLKSEEGALSIVYDLPLPNFYLEYYYDGITGQPNKAFSYQFKSPYAVSNLEVEVQQPLRSSNFNLKPSDATVTSGGQGFKYYLYSFKDVTPGQVISLDASYTKADSKPSVAKKQQGSAGTANSSLPIILTVIGLMIVGVVAWLVLSQRRRRFTPRPAHAASARTAARTPPRRHEPVRSQPVQPGPMQSRVVNPQPAQPKTAQSKAARSPKPQVQKPAFCSMCGTRLVEGHNFCPGCGAQAGNSSPQEQG